MELFALLIELTQHYPSFVSILRKYCLLENQTNYKNFAEFRANIYKHRQLN